MSKDKDSHHLRLIFGQLLLGAVNSLRQYGPYRRHELATLLFRDAPRVGAETIRLLSSGDYFEDLDTLQRHLHMKDDNFEQLIRYVERRETDFRRNCPDWCRDLDDILNSFFRALETLTGKAKADAVGQLKNRLEEYHITIQLVVAQSKPTRPHAN